MKTTKNQALSMLKGLKNGLSMIVAFVLLSTSFQPIQVSAASSEAVEALFPADAPVTPEAVETVSTPESVQDVLLKICRAHGFDIDCAKHLLGMVMQESVGLATAVGDHGYARGWFQINKIYNPDVTRACAEDLVCSAEWTLTRLEKKGYGKNAAWNNWAIWCHNGCGISKSYVPNVLRKGKAQWNTPLELVTADQLRQLALNK